MTSLYQVQVYYITLSGTGVLHHSLRYRCITSLYQVQVYDITLSGTGVSHDQRVERHHSDASSLLGGANPTVFPEQNLQSRDLQEPRRRSQARRRRSQVTRRRSQTHGGGVRPQEGGVKHMEEGSGHKKEESEHKKEESDGKEEESDHTLNMSTTIYTIFFYPASPKFYISFL